ncbi:MAG: dihydrolipoyl dehydrogenase [Propionibacteriaceae bacterium]|nr:dihydrolipoyl dehydrogenase [Propionibacteriaceae bacterium]
MDTHVDVAVLGAGPGGYVAAIRAAQLGLSAAVVEQQWWGGVCLNVGCIPTKSLLRNAELADLLTRHADDYGIGGQITLDYAKAYARSRAVSDRMARGVRYLMKKNHIEQVDGRGTFTDAHTLAVDGPKPQTLTFDHAIVATGATPKMLRGIEPGPRVLTYRDLIMSEQLPASIVIAGSGPIGVEFAFVLASYGVQVCIVEYLDRMLPGEDAEVSAELAKRYAKLGIEVLTSTKVCGSVERDGLVTVNLEPVGGGEGFIRQADALLVAVGFAPSSAGFGLEGLGVALDASGAIVVDEAMRTSVAGLYAIGDVTGKAMLAHTASAQGMIAAETIAGRPTIPIDYRMIPHATYCQPQVASFGLTEAQAREQGLDIRVNKFPFLANGKAVGLGEPTGFVKIVADAAHGEILGAHLIGPDVTELLPELTLAQLWDLTTDEVARNIHAHPTLSEAVKQACEGINGQMIDA